MLSFLINIPKNGYNPQLKRNIPIDKKKYIFLYNCTSAIILGLSLLANGLYKL